MQNQNDKPSDARRLGTYLGILGIGLIVAAFAFKIFGIDQQKSLINFYSELQELYEQ